MITNLKGLFKAVCDTGTGTAEEMQRDVARRLYNDYDCGPWIEFHDDGVTLGSIVEGSDVCAESIFLNYPFTYEELDVSLHYINDEVSEIFNNIWDDNH